MAGSPQGPNGGQSLLRAGIASRDCDNPPIFLNFLLRGLQRKALGYGKTGASGKSYGCEIPSPKPFLQTLTTKFVKYLTILP